jgi:hypothetical protein
LRRLGELAWLIHPQRFCRGQVVAKDTSVAQSAQLAGNQGVCFTLEAGKGGGAPT